MPPMTPFVSVEMILGMSDSTSDFALEEPDSSTPTLVQPALGLVGGLFRMRRDVPFLRRDASEDDDEDEDADRQEPEQDDRRARRSRNAVALQHADQRHRHGRDDRPGHDWAHDRVRRSEQPDERRQEREDADQEPRRPAEVPQPARRREQRRQFIELHGSDHEGLAFVEPRRPRPVRVCASAPLSTSFSRGQVSDSSVGAPVTLTMNLRPNRPSSCHREVSRRSHACSLPVLGCRVGSRLRWAPSS